MNNIDHETMKYLLSNKVDLFAFMNLSGRFTEDQYFSDKYNEKLKKYYRKNCKLYHPDKLHNASPEEQREQSFKFSLNSAIYRILSDRELFSEYKKSIALTSKTNIDLKSDYYDSRDEIIRIIEDARNSKSFEERVKDKELLHGINRDNTNGNATQFKDKELDMDTFTKLLTNYEAERVKLTTDLQNQFNNSKSVSFDEKKFNQKFEDSLLVNTEPTAQNVTMITSSSGVSGGILTNTFDINRNSYDTLYEEPKSNTIDNSFVLLSSHIDKTQKFDTPIDYEEAIKRYQSRTIELSEIVKKSKKD